MNRADDLTDEFPEEPVSGVRLSVPAESFSVHAKDGRVIATCPCILDALRVQRDFDAGEDVRRVSDGVLLATKHRIRGGGHVFSWAWRLNREPERV